MCDAWRRVFHLSVIKSCQKGYIRSLINWLAEKLPLYFLFLYQVTISTVWWNYCVESEVIRLQLSTVKFHRTPFLCPPGKAEKPEKCQRMSFLLCCLLTFLTSCFFALFLFFIESFSRSRLPFLIQRYLEKSLSVCSFARQGFLFLFLHTAVLSVCIKDVIDLHSENLPS